MKPLTKIYLETTNICNLSCSFCHGTRRKKSMMSYDTFIAIIEKLRGKAKYLYLHLMGEPLVHPDLPRMAHVAHSAGFDVMLTTNGTLLPERGAFIYKSGDVKKISISLQAADIVDGTPSQICGDNFDKYISDATDFAYKCAENGVICVLRLWNIKKNTSDSDSNSEILRRLHAAFPDEWIKNRSGYKLIPAPRGQKEVYLEFGEHFEWPDESLPAADVSFCYALRDQVGILCDGTVVPCCLDADGAVPLGNILDSDLDTILASDRARTLLCSFDAHSPSEPLCRSCGYASRF